MHKLTLSFILLLLTFASNAQEFTKSDFLADLAYFKTTLPQRHVKLFSKINEQDFNRKIEAIAQKADSLNDETFIAELQKLIVAIGDEHTFVQVNYPYTLPVKFEQFKEGIYITGVDAKHQDALMGKLIAIDGIKMPEISKRFKEVILSENDSYFQVALLQYLNNPSFLKGLKITPNSKEAVYTLVDSNGKVSDITLQAVLKTENNNMKLSDVYLSLWSAKKSDFYWYQYDDKNSLVYFNYSKCREMENKPFAAFNQELFAMLSEKKPKKIILDLRNNSGGNSVILQPFIDSIQKNPLNKRDRFYVLIGKKTFSSALMNAVELKRQLSVTLVGEPTSGSINHYGEVRGFNLPKTQLTIAYSTKFFETWKGKKGPLKPDVNISYALQKFKEGKDEALEYIYGIK